MNERSYKEHLILASAPIKEALARLDELAADAILFAVDDKQQLIGSLTDGDIRRGLLKGKKIEDVVAAFIQPKPKFIRKGKYEIEEVIKLRENQFKIIPILDDKNRIISVLNFNYQKSYLPVDAVIMAGGIGSRLMPLTKSTPKPLLKIGDKPIIDYNVNRLRMFGIDDLWITIRYLGEQIESYFKSKALSNIKIDFIWEAEPMGTIGAVSAIRNFSHDYILVTNSDILTNLNYEDFFLDFLEKEADMSVVTIPYHVNVPYAVMETSNNHVISFKEKPTYTYYSNGGIYLIRKEVLDYIPKNTFYNSTDLMQTLIKEGGKLVSYPLRQYWLDIGKHEDFKQAQEDIKHIQF